MPNRARLPHSNLSGRAGIELTFTSDGEHLPLRPSNSGIEADSIDYDTGTISLTHNLGDGISAVLPGPSAFIPTISGGLGINAKVRPHKEFEKVLQNDEQGNPQDYSFKAHEYVDFILIAYCSSTKTRLIEKMVLDGEDTSTYSSSIEFPEGKLSKSLTLELKVTRATASKNEKGTIAHRKGSVIATSPITTIYCDRRKTSGIDLIEYKTQNFQEHEVLWPFKANFYWLDFSKEDVVTCWLNSNSNRWCEMMDWSGSSSSKRTKLADLMKRTVVSPILTSVYFVSALHYLKEGDDGSSPDLRELSEAEGWKANALAHLSKIGGKSIEDRQSWLDTLFSELNGGDFSALSSQIASFVQAKSNNGLDILKVGERATDIILGAGDY